MVPGQFQYMWHSLKVNLQPKKKILSLLLSTFILECDYELMGVYFPANWGIKEYMMYL